MRIVITTGGSRGDLQPYLALGMGLQRAGAEVRIATAKEFESLVREHGLDFYPVELDIQRVLGSLLEDSGGPLKLARGLADQFGPVMEQNLSDFWSATDDADAVIWGTSGFVGHYIARARGIPSASAEMQPILRPTSYYRSSVIPPLPSFLATGKTGHIANRLSYVAVHEMFWQSFRKYINGTLAKGLGLEPMIALDPGRRSADIGEPVLCAWSPSVLPEPPDYGQEMHVTGYWFLDSGEWEPPAGLTDFLDSGPPPVSVGFGSVNSRDAEKMLMLSLEALRRSGHRAVLLTGWSGVEQSDLPDDVFALEEAPHDWLFPRMAAAVHHAGAGTTGASLRAGVPTITIPFLFDERFWAQRVAELGAGPAPLPSGKVSASRLADAISEATSSESIARRARDLGGRIGNEDGVASAIEALEHHGVLR